MAQKGKWWIQWLRASLWSHRVVDYIRAQKIHCHTVGELSPPPPHWCRAAYMMCFVQGDVGGYVLVACEPRHWEAACVSLGLLLPSALWWERSSRGCSANTDPAGKKVRRRLGWCECEKTLWCCQSLRVQGVFHLQPTLPQLASAHVCGGACSPGSLQTLLRKDTIINQNPKCYCEYLGSWWGFCISILSLKEKS